jgi:hypothetical protein
MLTAVSTLVWDSVSSYHGATGNPREALCSKRTCDFPPPSARFVVVVVQCPLCRGCGAALANQAAGLMLRW